MGISVGRTCSWACPQGFFRLLYMAGDQNSWKLDIGVRIWMFQAERLLFDSVFGILLSGKSEAGHGTGCAGRQVCKGERDMGEESRQEFKFDVFISYRHAELDSAVAGYLQKTLEHYKIPKEIQKKCGKRNINRVFRDEEELGVASDLFSEIEQNLKQSEFLLVICSPRIVQSKWCLREIETFIKYRGRENVLAVLIEGEPETAFPAPLLEEGEPLAADLRGANKKEVLRHARQRMPRLVAPLIYCTYDELYQRHRVYKMRRMMALAGIVAAVSLGFGAVAVRQNLEIKRNYQAKLENQSRHLAQTSSDLLGQGDREAALLVALEALPRSSTDTSRPYVAEARVALEAALYTYDRGYPFNLRPQKVLEHKGAPGSCIDYNEEENVLLTADTRIYIWDGDTGENICCWEDDGRVYKDAKLAGKNRVVALTDEGLLCFDYTSRKILWEWEYPWERESLPSLCWDYNAATDTIICSLKSLYIHLAADHTVDENSFDSYLFYIVDAGTGQSRAWEPSALYKDAEESVLEQFYLNISFQNFSLSPNGKQLLVTWSKWLEDGSRAAYLRVIPLGETETVFSMDYPGLERLENVTWLDDTELAVIETVEGIDLLGFFGQERKWKLTCWQLAEGQPRFTYEDISMSLHNTVSVEAIPRPAGETDFVPIIVVVYDNVAVNLDRYTGQRYSRMEDRSSIVLSHTWTNNGRQLFITADGYVFITSAMKDQVFSEEFTLYHYYLDLDTIVRAEWYNGKAYLYAGRNVYCYSAEVDGAYTDLKEVVSAGYFSGDSSKLLLLSAEQVYLYDNDSFELLWQDSCRRSSSDRNAAFVGDSYVVYMDKEENVVRVHSILDGTDREIPLENDARFQEPSTTSRYWNLCAVDDSRVILCDSYTSGATYGDDENFGTAVWMADVVQGTITAQWSYQDLQEQSPVPVQKDCYISVEYPTVTADGKYAIIPARISSSIFSEEKIDLSFLTVWDLETGQPVTLSDEIQHGAARALPYSSYYAQDGWLSPQESRVILYDEECGLLRVADIVRNEVLCELPVDGIGSMEVSFTPDGDHIIFQDAALHLQVYNWKTGEYTMREAVPEKGSLQFDFYQEGQRFSATMMISFISTKVTGLYQRQEDGVYRLDSRISFCIASDGKTAVIVDEAFPRLYHVYTLDELIAKAREILNGRELTETERKSYLID